MLDLVEKYTGFIGCTDSYEHSGLIIIGAPMDLTVSFRPGTRLGPQQIRRVSHGLEEYSIYLGKDLGDYRYYDAGDVSLPYGNIQEGLSRIGRVVSKILFDGKFPLVLGGEHLITLAVLREVVKLHPDVAVVVFDAHADLRNEYLGEEYSHATVMRRIIEVIGGKNLYQFGIRSGIREEFAFASENTNMYINEIIPPLQEVLQQLNGRPVYVSLDIDVVDPAYAPGTGTAEPGGCTSREILKAIHLLGELNVVGFDLVEVSPVYDIAEQTALLAAKLVREAIISFARPYNR
ncbi:agmatinase [Pelotomaculum terephthalicicum JT]|uniref:agmatinase n=1 Tax=Pelotomaculum TaxID=191373 RepID=UPI0009D51DC6|nr:MULTISPECIES: agmatinase [Pelotomaculum]MCG9968038.1 agmatinase [Pelotomaculum terephthalicicum JT]OPX85665.1 MAG: Agmatinase [Pelotomaculum sp. PtaB.Bin117]OPY63963.1 MAG: Agmatinase [Pelotomaculum sp. PtaU1.Bin065]